jgi:phage RecT family recombinase
MSEMIIPVPKKGHPPSEGFCNIFERYLPHASAMGQAEQNLFFASLVAEIKQLPSRTELKSVLMAAMNLTILGLVPGRVLGHAYLVPYRDNCQVIIGYQGYLELAFRNEFLSICHPPQLVLEGEEFSRWNDEKGNHFRHEPSLNPPEATRQNVLGAYVSYQTKLGGHGYSFTSREEIDKIDTTRNVWASDYAAMCLKTPIRRAAKVWKKSRGIGLALMLDEQSEAGQYQTCEQDFQEAAPDAAGNLEKNLTNRLDKSIGCQNSTDRDAVISWAMGSRHKFKEAVRDKELMKTVMNRFQHYTEDGEWTEILKLAKSNGDKDATG